MNNGQFIKRKVALSAVLMKKLGVKSDFPCTHLPKPTPNSSHNIPLENVQLLRTQHHTHYVQYKLSSRNDASFYLPSELTLIRLLSQIHKLLKSLPLNETID